MIRPLIIAPHILWRNDSVGFVERPFFNSLPHEEYEPCILCDEHGLLEYEQGFNNVVKIRRSSFWIYLSKVLYRLGLGEFLYPDSVYYSWGKRCKNKVVEMIKSGELSVDYIHSCSFPASDHLMAFELKKQFGIPWVAQFFDPWAGNPYRELKFGFSKRKDEANELLVAQNADLILHNSQPMCDMWLNRYGDIVKDKMLVLPMATNFTEYKKSVCIRKQGQLEISHIGNLYGNRTSKPFLLGLKKFINSYPEMETSLHVNFIGSVSSGDLSAIENLSLQRVVNVTGRLSEKECQEYYDRSDIFLAIDAENNEYNIFYPSKILKYFYYEKPILGITPIGSVLNDELAKSGHVSFDNKDIDGISSYFYRAMTDYSSLLKFDNNYWMQFQSSEVVSTYISMINRYILCQK